MKTKDINSKPMDADKKKKTPQRKRKDEIGVRIGGNKAAEAIEPEYKTYSGYDKIEKPIRVKKYSAFLDDMIEKNNNEEPK